MALGTLGGIHSEAWGINEIGQVVGYSTIASGQQRAFLYYDGSLNDLGTLGGDHSVATAINNAGQVVGYSSTVSGYYHAFLWQSNTGMIDLNTLGGNHLQSYAYGINDAGQIVGYSTADVGNGGYSQAFLYSAGLMTGLPGIIDARDINNAGQIVGFNGLTGFLLSPTPVPIPPAIWLFSFGLVGIFGVARPYKRYRSTCKY